MSPSFEFSPVPDLRIGNDDFSEFEEYREALEEIIVECVVDPVEKRTLEARVHKRWIETHRPHVTCEFIYQVIDDMTVEDASGIFWGTGPL